jgi:alkyl hydroperoxide reductase subunit F
MLDPNLKAQLAVHLQRIVHPVQIVASLDDRPASAEMRALLEDLQRLSPQLQVRFDGTDARRPSFSISREGADMGLRFAAVPLGHEFTSLVLALLHAGGVAPKLDAAVVEQIRGLEGEFVFETFMSLTCHNCPDVVQALNAMAVLNPRVRHVAIDGALFRDEVEARGILAVPSVHLNGQAFASGRMEIGDILAKIDTDAVARDAERLVAKEPFDVLIVGGGPAGAAAAVYAARKGIRTGVVAERFGGQTLDTLGIENYVSVPETTGPKFAAALEAHARAYDVDLMNGQRVVSLQPAAHAGEPAAVRLKSGAELKGRTVILAPGARWREVGVPGEAEYRNKGVAYCPHCDGPLFKGKRVAVIGGGNSGVEAAIDLAGLAAHVTLVEYLDQPKADAVLVARLKSLPNVTVVTNAKTTEITGDGRKVNGLRYVDRTNGAEHHVPLSGVFVQIGLQPNTDWLRGAVELSRHGEIVVDARGATSTPGVFAAGDATTVPFKQIVIAAGDGAKAALAAFEHLIRGDRAVVPAAEPAGGSPGEPASEPEVA